MDARHVDEVVAFQDRLFRIGGFNAEDPDAVSYTNTTRTEPLPLRFKGEQRLARLLELKVKWDSQNLFPWFPVRV